MSKGPGLQCSRAGLLESQEFDCGCKSCSLQVTSFSSHVSTWFFICNKALILLHSYLPQKKQMFSVPLLDKFQLNKAKQILPLITPELLGKGHNALGVIFPI